MVIYIESVFAFNVLVDSEEGNPQNELTSGAKNGMIQRDKCEEEEQYPHLKAKREGGRCKPLCRMWGSRLGAAALKRE